MSKTIEEYRDISRKAQDAIYKIELAERKEVSERLVGKTFKYQNCYSCPETPSDYWWLYLSVTGVADDGHLVCRGFQTDKNGDIEIRFSRHQYNHLSGYIPIPASEYRRAFAKMQRKIAQAKP